MVGQFTKRRIQMAISRITEIKSSSTKSFDDAIKSGISRANKTLKHVVGAWIENQEVLVDEKGQISEYRVEMKISFLLEE
jgi:flavin-binding protein dodecin